jgi:hypothetical protein
VHAIERLDRAVALADVADRQHHYWMPAFVQAATTSPVQISLVL